MKFRKVSRNWFRIWRVRAGRKDNSAAKLKPPFERQKTVGSANSKGMPVRCGIVVEMLAISEIRPLNGNGAVCYLATG